MVIKGYYFNFNIYTYYLYKCSGVDNIYIIQQNLKNIKVYFEKPCFIFIFIKNKLFTHYY